MSTIGMCPFCGGCGVDPCNIPHEPKPEACWECSGEGWLLGAELRQAYKRAREMTAQAGMPPGTPMGPVVRKLRGGKKERYVTYLKE